MTYTGTPLTPPTTFDNAKSVDYASNAVEYSRDATVYDNFIMRTNYGDATLAQGLNNVYGNIYDNEAGLPDNLQSVVQTYLQPVWWTTSAATKFTYGKTQTVSTTEETSLTITGTIKGTIKKAVSVEVETAYEMKNILNTTDEVDIEMEFSDQNGDERFYVAWLQYFRFAVCANGASTPFQFNGGVKDNAPWFTHRRSGGNRQVTFNVIPGSDGWVNMPGMNMAYAVYDLQGNIIQHAT
ncbi:hypothetical protein [Tateyamaria sp. syn59]|uniref:hypothetical protein n=1 Tax=Tateyamaria sp. syn59 TaxID=2576942 RepID=UPI0011BEC0C2|nr:hypothetical protein [Tateyamaria sp. syn59]